MTTLLPNAKQQFLSAAGVPLAGGSVYFYIPGTTTFKNTWQDGSQIALNTNPVILDSAGEAVIFGLGAYRQIVFDALGNQIWDQLTASTDAGGIYSGGTSTGTAANQIVASTTPAGFSLTSGNQLTFIAGFTSTGATTLNANGTGAKNITKPGASGPVAIGIGDIVVGDAVMVYYDGTQYQLINPVALPLTGGSLSGALNEAKATIASATSTAIGAAAGNYLAVTGTTTITSFDTIQAGSRRILEFAGALILTHNATTLILPGAANITTAAGDVAMMISEGSGNWRCAGYMRANGQAVTPAPFTAKFNSTAQTMITTTGAVATVAHGLSQRPDFCVAVARCTTTEGGYAVGDEVPIPGSSQVWNGSSNIATGATVEWDATNVHIVIGSGTALAFQNKTTGASFGVTAGSWALYFRAWY